MDVATLVNEVRAMKPSDREIVLAALDEPEDGHGLFSEEQLAELDRRLDAYEAGRLASKSWGIVRTGWSSKNCNA